MFATNTRCQQLSRIKRSLPDCKLSNSDFDFPPLTRAYFNDESLDAEVAGRGRRDREGDFVDGILLRAEHELDLLWHIVDEILKKKRMLSLSIQTVDW